MIPRRAVGQSLEGHTSRRVRELVEQHAGPFLERLIARMGYTHTDVAEAMDVSRQTLDQYLRGPSGKRGARLTMGVLYTLPLPIRALFAEDLVGPTHMVVERPHASSAPADRRWLTRMLRGHTDALTKAVDHGDDDRFSRAESAELRPMVRAALADLVRLDQLLEEAERTGVVVLEQVREEKSA